VVRQAWRAVAGGASGGGGGAVAAGQLAVQEYSRGSGGQGGPEGDQGDLPARQAAAWLGERAGQEWYRRPAWITLVQALSALWFVAAGGLRAVGGDAAVMAEQAISGFAGLLRQLRTQAQLTQQGLARRSA
jgi:hypothetical protein